jgi:hypothetical protein
MAADYDEPADSLNVRITMVTILKFIVILVILGGIGLVGYAYLGDLTPLQSDVVVPVMLDGN